MRNDLPWAESCSRRDSRNPRRTSPMRSLVALAAMTAFPFLSGCKPSGLPKPDSNAYTEEVSDFYVGLAALQVGDDVRADSSLAAATQLAPGEPAGWVNWGILALRQGNFDASTQRLQQAQKLAPKNDRVAYLLGLLESKRGNPTASIANLRQAVELNPHNLRAMYLLAQQVERQGDANSEVEFEQWMQKILAADPGNQAALLELARVAAKRGDAAILKDAVTQISAHAASWPPEVQQQLVELQTAAAGADPRAAALRTAFLRNSLMRVPEFRQSLNMLQPAAGDEAVPFAHFLRLPSPTFTPAPADLAMHFHIEPISTLNDGPSNWIGAISLTGAGAPVVASANGHTVKLSSGAAFPFPGGDKNIAPSPDSILPIDFNYDFKMDLVLAGTGGIRFLRQDSPQQFTDVTAQTKLPPSILQAPYLGAWALDVEADGDLDVLLGSAAGLPVVLRNNGDGSFTAIHPFAAISGVRSFVWVDLDGDGNPDAAIVDGSGTLHVFHNERSGRFVEVALPAGFPRVKAITAADVRGTGTLSLVVVEETGSIVRMNTAAGMQNWDIAEIAKVPDEANLLTGAVRLRSADLDNNGAMDLLLAPIAQDVSAASHDSGAYLWMGDGHGHFTLTGQPIGPAHVFDIGDVNNDGRLDLLGISADGQAQQAINAGTKNYKWQIIRPRARQATGDQRINSFGIGGEMEVRSGLLVQKQPIIGPQLHFGLGEQNGVDVVRILWPNGTARAEFALKADQEVVTEQRLKGSCPFLFAWNGTQMAFVKDAVPWGSAIGLQIDSVGSPKTAATEEWYKIDGDQLQPRNGAYDLRLTGELWETYYYDYLKLLVVDHPAGTEIYTDERFAVPPVKLAITAVATPHPVEKAIDDQGNDVTQAVRALDGKYLDTFGRGQYQGLTRDHYVEVDLGNDVPKSGPLWLIAQGWLHPTDSTVNVAISQGGHEKAHALSLEVPDGHGGWRVAQPNLGFPAGRKKTCLIDLSHVFLSGTPRKLRLRTNLEIFWDSIQWAQGLPETELKVTPLAPESADLRYRGYSVIHQANASSPEIPDYNHLAATTQIWRDLEGYYTRYGDVRALLARIDDRYIIMNAGDEIALRFAEQPSPPAGWVRDYVIAGDGWIKDGDYNSTNSRTIQPLPYHAKTLYNDAPGRLEDEWVYRHHPEDWQTYHTRYVTPQIFDTAVRSSTPQ